MKAKTHKGITKDKRKGKAPAQNQGHGLDPVAIVKTPSATLHLKAGHEAAFWSALDGLLSQDKSDNPLVQTLVSALDIDLAAVDHWAEEVVAHMSRAVEQLLVLRRWLQHPSGKGKVYAAFTMQSEERFIQSTCFDALLYLVGQIGFFRALRRLEHTPEFYLFVNRAFTQMRSMRHSKTEGVRQAKGFGTGLGTLQMLHAFSQPMEMSATEDGEILVTVQTPEGLHQYRLRPYRRTGTAWERIQAEQVIEGLPQHAIALHDVATQVLITVQMASPHVCQERYYHPITAPLEQFDMGKIIPAFELHYIIPAAVEGICSELNPEDQLLYDTFLELAKHLTLEPANKLEETQQLDWVVSILSNTLDQYAPGLSAHALATIVGYLCAQQGYLEEENPYLDSDRSGSYREYLRKSVQNAWKRLRNQPPLPPHKR